MNAALIPLFDRMVAKHFAPLADESGFSLKRLRNGLFEISGSQFGLRIRYGTGHGNNFLITVFPVQQLADDLDDVSSEIGLGVIAEFNGAPFQRFEIQSESDADAVFTLAATSVKSFAVPYLKGEKKDFDDVRQFIQRKIQKSGVREKKYHFPPNVREEWVLPERPD